LWKLKIGGVKGSSQRIGEIKGRREGVESESEEGSTTGNRRINRWRDGTVRQLK